MDRFWRDVLGTPHPGVPAAAPRDPFPESALMGSTHMRNITTLDAAFRVLWDDGRHLDVPTPPALLERNAARLASLPLMDAAEALRVILKSTKLGHAVTATSLETALAALGALPAGPRDPKQMLLQRLGAAMPSRGRGRGGGGATRLPPPHTPLPLAYCSIRSGWTAERTADRTAAKRMAGQRHPVVERLRRAGLDLTAVGDLTPAAVLTKCLDSGQFLRRFRGTGVWVHALCDDADEGSRLTEVCARLFPEARFLITASATDGASYEDALRVFAAFPPGIFRHAVAVNASTVPAQLASLASGASFVASFCEGGSGRQRLPDTAAAPGTSLTPAGRPLPVTGRGGPAPEWWTGVCADVVSTRMSGGERERRLACFHDMVVERVAGNWDAVVGAPPREDDNLPVPGRRRRRYSIVLLDTRENPWTVAALVVTLLNMLPDPELDLARDWNVCLFCGRQNVVYFREQLSTLAIVRGLDVHLLVLPELSVAHRAPAFGYTAYNQLFKSSSFWDRCLQHTEARCLFIQDDGMLRRTGLGAYLARHGHHSYVGAPWQEGQERLREWCGGAGSELVGNGGFSLRCPRVMRRAAARGEATGRAWAAFLDGEQVTPEDVYFVAGIGEEEDSGGGIAPRDVARGFSSEQVLDMASLGFHKVWAYHSDIPTLRRFFGGAEPPPLRSSGERGGSDEKFDPGPGR